MHAPLRIIDRELTLVGDVDTVGRMLAPTVRYNLFVGKSYFLTDEKVCKELPRISRMVLGLPLGNPTIACVYILTIWWFLNTRHFRKIPIDFATFTCRYERTSV